VSAGWGGRRSQAIRAQWAALLPLPCFRCGKPVTDDHTWDVEHDPPRSVAGDDAIVVGVSHATCNRSHGGRLRHRRPHLGTSREW
jgi:DNA-directed RNA polymerase subunit N (RpoN/RPB10)